ncbi:phosphoribosyltransferase domain-containing protein [Tenacibaculum sp. 1B UA]|uniref:phosphoribosyltransferase family protein n=1 Tax=Tenacibaculum sp. 1B UA TaxID=2922252 RepID=UPI002A24B495|nr:phosphoribosyltransferase family protein [Tenacibaculum sp. 1B UA]MDX8554113.1 phosphoribosyltransferase domain-containing protein [Tenacibaculum sp. 1B UA]
MTDTNNIILNNTQVEQKIRRIAFQIYESNSNETKIIIAGIADNGYFLAERISNILSEISPLEVTLCKVSIDKRNPISPITTSINSKEYQNKALVLVDDVLNSGTTLIYGVKHFLEVPLKRFKTAVLVNRNHKKYPVKADFKGISLSTSIKEHVVVEFKTNETIAYLT